MGRPGIRIDRDVEMRTRDGVILRADVWRPDISTPVPAIVARTPYDKTRTSLTNRYLPPLLAADAGFAFVVQDIRGRYSSDGEWDLVDLRTANVADGYDCVEWVASEPWCDGHVGMSGGSYVGVTQLSAADGHPPSLRAIAPSLLGMGAKRVLSHYLPLESLTIGWIGTVALDHLSKKIASGEADPAEVLKVVDALTHPDVASAALPLNDILVIDAVDLPSYREVMDMVVDAIAGGQVTDFEVPALWTTGWYDYPGGAELFNEMRAGAATEVARTGTRMLFGPWTHTYAENFVGSFGLGPAGGALDAMVPQHHLAYYSRHLRGDDTDVPVVRYYVMGAKVWKDADAWPIPGTDFQRHYLRSRGRANTAGGDGQLLPDAPPAGESPDRYDYDPFAPVPSWGFKVMYTGGTTLAGPYEQTRVEKRQDVLVYTSPPLQREVEVVGDISLHIFVTSSAVDTDFVAKLCVVDRDDNSFNLADGFLRASLRRGWAEVAPLEPGVVEELVIEMGPTGYRFRPGESIRVQITSSAFPHLARNMNTGLPIESDAGGIVAHQTVLHDADHPSYLVLPVVPG